MSLRTILPIFQNLLFFITIILFFLGLFGYLYRHEPNYCGKSNCFYFKKIQDNYILFLEMTWMFENPVYHRISMPKNIENHYPRYSLYSYCEGIRCETHRRNQFSGIKYFSYPS
jgi:hypothetical protein